MLTGDIVPRINSLPASSLNFEPELNTPAIDVDAFIKTREFYDKSRLCLRESAQAYLQGENIEVGQFAFRINVVPKEGKLLAILAFRGTSNLENIKTDLNLILRSTREFSGLVHSGFYYAYQTLKEHATQALRETFNSHNIDEVLVTGHSLGGAIATLYGLDLIKERIVEHKNTLVITIASPQIGNKEFYNEVETWLPGCNIHLALTGDPVTFGLGVITAPALLLALCCKDWRYIHPENRLWLNMRGYIGHSWWLGFSIQMIDGTITFSLTDFINHTAGEEQDYCDALSIVQHRTESPNLEYNYNWRYYVAGTYTGLCAIYVALSLSGVGGALLGLIGLPILAVAGVAYIAISNIEYRKQLEEARSYVAKIEEERDQQEIQTEESKYMQI